MIELVGKPYDLDILLERVQAVTAISHGELDVRDQVPAPISRCACASNAPPHAGRRSSSPDR